MTAIETLNGKASPEATEAERAELDWLLNSGVLGRSANLARVLRYVCEERFKGHGEDIKEYSIAVEALGRHPDFDPQTDTIVRVTVHTLRKRLAEIYRNEGKHRPMEVVIPPGHYGPNFLRSPAAGSATETPPDPMLRPEAVPEPPLPVQPHSVDRETSAANVPVRPGRSLTVVLVLLALLVTALAIRYLVRTRAAREAEGVAGVSGSGAEMVRALLGDGRHSYTDRSGRVWAPGNFCRGGLNVNVPNRSIAGTEDPYLYFGGVRGISHCAFPVKPGIYEVHLLFAETTELPPATRPVAFSINAGPNVSFDVVDQAGGDGAATSTVVTGIAPENDGAIHLDITSEVSPLNAVEILPASSRALLPVRIVAGSRAFVDGAQQVWLSDRYFKGGRHGQAPAGGGAQSLGLYASNRIGHFEYDIPVAPMGRYQVKLYFKEPWFGPDNGGAGGAGSRIFNVACNGELLLKNFDMFVEAGTSSVVKTFDHIQANSTGRIQLSFIPVVNYPLVDAIEILPES